MSRIMLCLSKNRDIILLNTALRIVMAQYLIGESVCFVNNIVQAKGMATWKP